MEGSYWYSDNQAQIMCKSTEWTKKIGISKCYNALQFLKISEATHTKTKDSFGKLMKYSFINIASKVSNELSKNMLGILQPR